MINEKYITIINFIFYIFTFIIGFYVGRIKELKSCKEMIDKAFKENKKRGKRDKNMETIYIKDLRLTDLNNKIIEWAKEREIDKKGTIKGQMLKTVEETSELIKGICKNDIDLIKDSIGDVYVTLIIGNMLINDTHFEYFENNNLIIKENEIDIRNFIWYLNSTINDYIILDYTVYNYNQFMIMMLKYLISIADYYNVTLKECIELAYNTIAKRKGKIINGIFVKESDLK